MDGVRRAGPAERTAVDPGQTGAGQDLALHGPLGSSDEKEMEEYIINEPINVK